MFRFAVATLEILVMLLNGTIIAAGILAHLVASILGTSMQRG